MTYGRTSRGSGWKLMLLFLLILALPSAPVITGSRNPVVRYAVIAALVIGGLAWLCLR